MGERHGQKGKEGFLCFELIGFHHTSVESPHF